MICQCHCGLAVAKPAPTPVVLTCSLTVARYTILFTNYFIIIMCIILTQNAASICLVLFIFKPF